MRTSKYSGQRNAARSLDAHDQELLKGVVAGDRDAITDLYNLYFPRLFGFLYRLSSDYCLTEELVNDVMLIVWRDADKFRSSSKVSTWILGIGYRQCLKRLRKRRLPLVAKPKTCEAQFDGCEIVELDEVLSRALDELSPEHRMMIESVLYLGMTYREVAEIAGCPVNTAKTRVQTLKTRFKVADAGPEQCRSGQHVLIKTLKISNLRNIKAADFELHPRLNYLVGDNGAGKTGVLESIVVLAKGRSFRAGQIGALIGPENDWFRVVATTEHGSGKQQTLGIERSRIEWKARRNGENVRQLSDLAIHLPLILIEPNSHLLISGSPQVRRRFLDWGVFHVEHDYLLQWRRYTRALKQRNAALRKQDTAVVTSLDPIMSELGEKIDNDRLRQLNALSEKLAVTLNALSPALNGIKLRYDKGWKGEGLLCALQDAQQQDLERGATGPGPHRADIPVYLDGKLAKERLSRGEQKILSAALLLSQAMLMSDNGEKPLLLMDDLASEFDAKHLAAVMALVSVRNIA